MGRREISVSVVVVALEALAGGASLRAAARVSGLSVGTVVRCRDHHEEMMRSRVVRCRAGSLTVTDREQILVGIVAGESDSVIGSRLGFHRSTVWREVRNNGGREGYSPCGADARARREACRVRDTWVQERPWLFEIVLFLLGTKKWSPEQISKRLKLEHPDAPEWWVSHESIYQAFFVQAKPELRKELTVFLRSGRVRRRSHGEVRGQRGKGSSVPGMINISERPAEVEDRAVPGHWEGDLILGRNGRSSVVTLVERATRFGMLVQVDSKQADVVADRIGTEIARLPKHVLRSLTWDQGSELASHARFTVDTGIPVFFCDPKSPWQRGSNENWNGLVRQFLPKGTDLSSHTQDQLDDISALLNERPRKTLNWETPAEQFNKFVAATT